MRSKVSVCAAALMFASAAFATSAPAKEITASVWFPDTHPLTRDGYLALAKTLAEKSGGKLTMKVYTGSAILPPAGHLSGLRDGVVQMTYHAGTYTPSDLPEDNVLATYGITLRDPMTVTAAVADFYINDPGMQAMFAKHGIVFLGSYSSPSYILMCREKVSTVAEAKGKKIRMPSTVHTAWAKAVGAASVSVPSSEMFSGLEKGQIDCAANAANDLKSRSLWDVAKHVTMLDLGPYFAGWEYAMNGAAWKGLTTDERRLLLDAISDNLVDLTLAYVGSVDAALAEGGAHGVKVHEPSADLQKNLDDFLASEVEKMATETATKLRAADGAGLSKRFLATYAKWQGLMKGVNPKDGAAIKALFSKEIYSKVNAATYGAK